MYQLSLNQDHHSVFQRDIRGKYLILTNKANQQNY